MAKFEKMKKKMRKLNKKINFKRSVSEMSIGFLLTMAVVATVAVYFVLVVAVLLFSGIGSADLLFDNRVKLAAGILSFVVLLAVVVVLSIQIAADKQTKEDEKTRGNSRFYKLIETDEEMEHYKAPEYNEKITLEELCDDFRNYAASRLGLYYEKSVIRAFISSLAVTRLVIMQGISGTGKTSLAYAAGKFFGNDAVIVPVQPSWKERSDLLGYFNEFTKTFNETELLSKIYEANYTDDVYITVLDEMNIARVEYYFAEFLSLLEMPLSDEWIIDVVADSWDNDPKKLEKGRIRLPENMWYVGTANNDDSTLSISDKVYDRAMVIDLDHRAKAFDAPFTEPIKLSDEYLRILFDEAKKRYTLSDSARNSILQLDAFLQKKFSITFGNRIMHQIEGYVPVYMSCGGSENEAIDAFMAKKVFRKLETKNPVFVRSYADELIKYLDDLFGADAMPICKASMNRYTDVN